MRRRLRDSESMTKRVIIGDSEESPRRTRVPLGEGCYFHFRFDQTCLIISTFVVERPLWAPQTSEMAASVPP